MKLLYVTEGVPNRDPRLGDGSSMISFEVIRNLDPTVSVTLVTYSDGMAVPPEVIARCDRVVVLRFIGRRVAIARSIVSSHSIGSAYHAVHGARRAVATLSGEADVTLMHGPHVTFLAPAVHGPLVIQVVDPWPLHAAMDADLARGPLRWYRRFKSRQALAWERRSLPARARLLTVGSQDALRWSKALGRPVRAVDNGVDQTPAAQRRSSDVPTVCFVGSLNYGPNIDSATRLVTEVAPLVWAVAPTARFVIAGRQPTAAVLALAGPRVEVLADVPSVAEVFAAADVAVFCDRHGLGMRNSVREAMAAGVPVVATTSAAREQGDPPLLTVADALPDMVRAVLAHLAAGRPASTAPVDDHELRGWRTMAAEYEDECRQAMSA